MILHQVLLWLLCVLEIILCVILFYSSILSRIPWVYELLPVNKEYTKHCHLVHAFAKKIIEERRNEILCKKEKASSRVEAKKYLDFIDILLQTKVCCLLLLNHCIILNPAIIIG